MISLYPKPKEAGKKIQVFGYFFTDKSEWEDDDTHWLINNEPQLLLHLLAHLAYTHAQDYEKGQFEFDLFQAEFNSSPATGIPGLKYNLTQARLVAAPFRKITVPSDTVIFNNLNLNYDDLAAFYYADRRFLNQRRFG